MRVGFGVNAYKVTRSIRDQFSKAAKETYRLTGREYQQKYKDKRFTEQHAREAGYTPRKGEGMPQQGSPFKRSYMGRKLRLFKHQRPLEYSGQLRNC